MKKTFALHDGDTVLFRPRSGRDARKGTLKKRPYGRRLHAVVRDERNVVHLLPSRAHIIDVVQ